MSETITLVRGGHVLTMGPRGDIAGRRGRCIAAS